jgi:hypothetical protein
LSIVFTKRNRPKQEADRAECTEAIGGDYATVEGNEKSHPRNQKRKQSIGLLFRFWNDVFRPGGT